MLRDSKRYNYPCIAASHMNKSGGDFHGLHSGHAYTLFDVVYLKNNLISSGKHELSKKEMDKQDQKLQESLTKFLQENAPVLSELKLKEQKGLIRKLFDSCDGTSVTRLVKLCNTYGNSEWSGKW